MNHTIEWQIIYRAHNYHIIIVILSSKMGTSDLLDIAILVIQAYKERPLPFPLVILTARLLFSPLWSSDVTNIISYLKDPSLSGEWELWDCFETALSVKSGDGQLNGPRETLVSLGTKFGPWGLIR